METKHIVIAIVASAALSALASAAVMQAVSSEAPAQSNQTELLKRIQKLETKLSREQEARELLQDIVSQRAGRQSSASSSNFGSADEDRQENQEQAANNITPQFDPAPVRPTRAQIREQRIAQAQPEYQVQRLVGKGFSEDEAKWILNSESDVALNKLNNDYQRRKVAAGNDEQRSKSSRELLREQLGDEYYERYLKANGYATSARIDEVMLGSPGANAGLSPGDKITAYGGKRVFDLRDVNTQTYQGETGESVLIEIERNGEPLQLTIPRGPIGISGGRGR